MNDNDPSVLPYPKTVAVLVLAAASIALSLGFACAVPLAAFATISALVFTRRAALGAILSVWLANQFVGFGWLHYPTDPSTLAWGTALGVIAVGASGTAQAVLARSRGPVETGLAFLAAFGVYEGAIYAVCLASGTDTAHFTVAVVSRIFLINAVTFVVLVALWALALRTHVGRRFDTSLSQGHA